MKKKIEFTIGALTYDKKNNFFYGNLNGQHVVVNEGETKKGEKLWFVKQVLNAYVTDVKAEKETTTIGA